MTQASQRVNPIDNKDRYLKLKWKEQYLDIINKFSMNIMHLNSIEDVVWGIAKEVISRMGFEDCVVYLLDHKRKVLIQKAAYGPKNPASIQIKDPIIIPIGHGIVGTVAASGVAEIIKDTRQDHRYILDDRARLSEIAIPIIYENEVIGVIDSEHSRLDFFTNEHLVILETIAAISASKIMHAKANDKLLEHHRNLEKNISEKTKDLREAIAQLKRSNLDLESFAYAASHDLLEPLRTIQSYIQLIQRREKNLSSESQEFFDFVIKGAERMKFLLQGLLAYSRIKSNPEEEVEEVQMMDVMLMVKANLTTKLRETKGQILFDDMPSIKGNKVQLIQLFQNFISNSLKFCQEGVAPIVEVKVKEVGPFVEFEIKDNGIGIDPSYHDKIFDLFLRLNPVGSYQGSGIGLSLCKRIIEYHKGEIHVNSEQGKGTSFFLRFPK